MKNHISPNANVVKQAWLLTLLPVSLFAQPASIDINALTEAQYRSLPDRQVIVSEGQQTTLGALREGQAALQSSQADWLADSNDRRASHSVAIEKRHEEAAARKARRANAEVQQLLDHFARLNQENPELAARAATTDAQRKEVYQLWLKSTRASSRREVRRINDQVRRIERSRNQ